MSPEAADEVLLISAWTTFLLQKRNPNVDVRQSPQQFCRVRCSGVFGSGASNWREFTFARKW
jgi:hypothetical protein